MAVVSGGTNGIGRAITVTLARVGWHVVAFGPDAPQPGSTAADGVAGTRAALDKAGLDALVLDADVTSDADRRRVLDAALARTGHLDGLVNNAAIRPRGAFPQATEADLRAAFEVDVVGLFCLSQLCLDALVASGRGAIVNVGSAAGWGRPGLAAYGAAKGAVHALSQSMAYDLAPLGVRVNTLVPGRVRTGMVEDQFGDSLDASRFPTTPGDAAEAVCYLLSERASSVNGALLNVGGFHLQGG